MISFKEFLIEKKMGTSYAQVFKRLEDDAKIGFEIEVFVPTDTHFHRPQDTAQEKTTALTDIQSWIQIRDLFVVDRSREGTIMTDFGRWKTEVEDDWVDAHWQDYESGDDKDSEKRARRTALQKAENMFTFDAWLRSIGTMHEFIDQYELEPSYGWATDDAVFSEAPVRTGYHSGFKNTASAMAEHLARVLKQRVVVNGTGYAHWNLTHDTSIKDSEGRDDESDQDGYGVEIVSPPLPPSKALESLEKVFKVLQDYEIETNESTGIHVNISLQNMEQFDPLKLVLFMGDTHVLASFDRLANTFTNSQLQRVVDSISVTGKIPKSADELIKLGREGVLETGKHFSVNVNHLPKYLEFRAAGGKDYHHKLSQIKAVVGRWLSAVELAANPEMYRKEYLKKVMQLLDKTSEGQEKKEVVNLTFTEYMRKKHQMFMDTLDDAAASDDQDYKVKALRSIMMVLGERPEAIEPVPFSWMKEVRALFSSMGVTAQDVLDVTNPGEAMKRVSTGLKAFKLVK